MNVCAGIVDPPLVARPVGVIPAGTVIVQLKVVFGTGELNVTGKDVAPLQIVCGAGENETPGVALTAIVKLTGAPVQPFTLGVIVYTKFCVEVPLFTNVIEGIKVLFPLVFDE